MTEKPKKAQWWIVAKSRATGNRSKVGPFKTMKEVSEYVDKYYNPLEWRIGVHLRMVKEHKTPF